MPREKGPYKWGLSSCMIAALPIIQKKTGYNSIRFTAYTHGILMGDTPKNGRAWHAHFSSDVRPFQGTFLLHF